MAEFWKWDRKVLENFAQECNEENQRLRTHNAMLTEGYRKLVIELALLSKGNHEVIEKCMPQSSSSPQLAQS